MKLAILTASTSRKAAGVLDSVKEPAILLRERLGSSLDIISLNDQYTEEDLHLWNPVNPIISSVIKFPGLSYFGYAPTMFPFLLKSNPDIVHSHGLWMHPSLVCNKWHQMTNRPYVISAHGMLNTWAIKNSSWKKKIISAWFQKAHLKNAACIHALNEYEAEEMRKYGLRNPICIIPNGLKVRDFSNKQPPPWDNIIDSSKKVLLYLGRFHPVKGLDLLIDAWVKCLECDPNLLKDWSLVLVGWSRDSYKQHIINKVNKLGLQAKIVIIDPQYGEQKLACYKNAQAYILPSFSEALPMSILEAWGADLPVLMTPQCNLNIGYDIGAAVKVLANKESIMRGIIELLSLTDAERIHMGTIGRRYVEARYSWSEITDQFLSVYSWIMKKADKPSFII